MSTKIKHRSRVLAVMFILSMAFIFIACMIPFRKIGLIVGGISIFLLSLSILFMLLSMLLKTAVKIENGTMSINFVCITYEIQISNITALSFSHKKRMIKGHTEYRVNLDIHLQKDNSAVTISLNDDATIFHNHLISDDEQIADENIPLYHVYTYLTELTGISGDVI